jgi:hypothetical protein
MPRHAGTAQRLRLTDQALVAVTAARRAGELDARQPSAMDLLVALATTEGTAAARLGDVMAGMTRLVERARHGSPRVATAEDVLRWAAGERPPRPVTTDDLLAATVELGGSELADAADAAGVAPHALRDEAPDDPAVQVAETLGLDPQGSQGWPLPCARAVARARAAGGSAAAVCVAVAVDPQLPAPVDVDTVWQRLRLAVGPGDWRTTAADRDDDAGVEAVVAAAESGARRGVVDALTLVQAARMAGGTLAAGLLAPPESVGDP